MKIMLYYLLCVVVGVLFGNYAIQEGKSYWKMVPLMMVITTVLYFILGVKS